MPCGDSDRLNYLQWGSAMGLLLEHPGVGEIAWDGEAQFKIYPEGSVVEVWERVVPFGGPAPDFELSWTGDHHDELTRSSLPTGCLYQVRLFNKGSGRPSGDGNVLSSLDFPSLVGGGFSRESPIIGRCQQTPQINFFSGGTFATASIAVCPPSMARIHLCSSPPVTHNLLGIFERGEAVASAVSLTTSSMHRLDITDRPYRLMMDKDPLLPGNEYYFVVLVWTSQGYWDFVWTLASDGLPGMLTLKRRRVQLKLTDLFVIDDSDDLSPGEATFKLVVNQGLGPSSTHTQSFGATVNSGQQLSVPSHMQMDTGFQKILSFGESLVSVLIKAYEDDTGSFPPDSDDYSSAHFLDLNMPSGPAEQVPNQILSIESGPGSGNSFKFIAQIVYSVSYE